MSAKKAKDHYIGRGGQGKLNCAQLDCRDIRQLKKLSCLGCVEQAEFIERL